MDKIVLAAEKRKVLGRKVKDLMQKGILPGNIFGKKIDSLAIAVKLSDFLKTYEKAGETSLVNLIMTQKGKKDERAVLISNVQFDSVSDIPIHIDFHQVDLKEKVTADVEVELIGESPAEKTGVGTVVQYIDEIEVEALPTDLPEKFVIDISSLSEVDQSVLVKDLKVDKNKVAIKVDAEEIVVKVEPPQKEEVIAPPAAEVSIEGEVPAEGEIPTGEEAKEEVKPPEERPTKGGKEEVSQKKPEEAGKKGDQE